MIEINNLSKSFNEKVVLDHLTLTVNDGSVIGLIGPNGSGKTTLLHLLCGSYQPSSGEILYDTLPVYDSPDVKKNILNISDETYFQHNETLNSLKAFYKVWYKDFNDDIFNQYVQDFNLEMNTPVKNFSKGMKRQAMLCIAFAISPKYLFLDEAFDGLDPIKRLEIKRAISSAVEEKNMTIIISSHNLRELEDICDQYIMIHNHQLLDSGSLLTDINVHKIQLAYSKVVTEELFKDLDLLSCQITGKVVNLVVKGDEETINQIIDQTAPVIKDILPVSLEELFIYEVENMEAEND